MWTREIELSLNKMKNYKIMRIEGFQCKAPFSLPVMATLPTKLNWKQ